MTTAPGPLSVLLTSLPFDFPNAVRQAADLGFTHVDVVGLVERPAAHMDALADAGVVVACAALGRDLPDGATLDADEIGLRRTAIDLVERQITDAARLGATAGYLVPPMRGEPAALTCFAEAVGRLADHAARRMVRLCVEPVPGRALKRADTTVAWLRDCRLDRVGLLLDVGHCLISGEDAAAAAQAAAGRLGYVHLDDNDAVGDLHWPLLTGQLTEDALRRFLTTLPAIGYLSGLSLELSPRLADPVAALRDSRAIVARCQPLRKD
jgi:sugar phosphate isomerase/epimerase